jgi:heme/copper-type cytochrome/quinol oxidase subunit 2
MRISLFFNAAARGVLIASLMLTLASAQAQPSKQPSFSPTVLPSLSTITIVGIVIAVVALMLVLFVVAYLYRRRQVTFIDDLLQEKERENEKSEVAMANRQNKPVAAGMNFDPLMTQLKELLHAGEKWKRCYHSESDQWEQCFVELWRSALRKRKVLSAQIAWSMSYKVCSTIRSAHACPI